MSYIIEFKWKVGEKATVDSEIEGHIVQILVDFGELVQYKVEWFNGGALQTGWFHEHRLS